MQANKTDQESKGAKRANSQRIQGPKLLAETNQPSAGAPAPAGEPVEVQDPLVAVPEEARDAEVAVGVPPFRTGEDQVERPQLRRDLVLLLEHPLSVVLAGEALHGDGAFHHGGSHDGGLAALEEGHELQVGLTFDLVALLGEGPSLLPLVVDQALGGLQLHARERQGAAHGDTSFCLIADLNTHKTLI